MESWKRVFDTPLYFELYEAEDTRKAAGEVHELVRLLTLQLPARVLDVPCGYGRLTEIGALFARAGLRLEAVYGGLGGEPYSIESEDAVFVATRA